MEKGGWFIKILEGDVQGRLGDSSGGGGRPILEEIRRDGETAKLTSTPSDWKHAIDNTTWD